MMQARTPMMRPRRWLRRCRRAGVLLAASASLASVAAALSGCAIEIPLNPARTPPPAQTPAKPVTPAKPAVAPSFAMLMILVAVMLGGCAVGPDYRRPLLPSPAGSAIRARQSSTSLRAVVRPASRSAARAASVGCRVMLSIPMGSRSSRTRRRASIARETSSAYSVARKVMVCHPPPRPLRPRAQCIARAPRLSALRNTIPAHGSAPCAC